jgi:hypothetical protein
VPTSTSSTGVSLFGSSPVQPPSATVAAASVNNRFSGADFGGAAGYVSPANAPTTASTAASDGGWATGWQDSSSSKMSVSTGSSNRSGVSSPPAVNPFTGAPNLTQLNTSPWPSSSGTSPVNAKSKAAVATASAAVASPLSNPAPARGAPSPSFTAQWPTSSQPAVASAFSNDPFKATSGTKRDL